MQYKESSEIEKERREYNRERKKGKIGNEVIWDKEKQKVKIELELHWRVSKWERKRVRERQRERERGKDNLFHGNDKNYCYFDFDEI